MTPMPLRTPSLTLDAPRGDLAPAAVGSVLLVRETSRRCSMCVDCRCAAVLVSRMTVRCAAFGTRRFGVGRQETCHEYACDGGANAFVGPDVMRRGHERRRLAAATGPPQLHKGAGVTCRIRYPGLLESP